MPDYYVHRYAGGASLLASGYCFDMGWIGCSLAWLPVGALLIWWGVKER